MRKLILTIALAFGIAMPFANTADARIGNQVPETWKGIWYINKNTVPVYLVVGGGFDGEPEIEREICRLNRGDKIVVTHWGGDISVQTVPRSRCEGYIKARDIHHVAVRELAVELNVATAPQPTQRTEQNVRRSAPGKQTIFTGGRWGNRVPIFYERRHYYSARYSMDREGNYNSHRHRVVCTPRIGTEVKFIPYRNWGVGEVQVVGSPSCKGWIDRAVIQ